jgi:general secretion pathway protein A
MVEDLIAPWAKSARPVSEGTLFWSWSLRCRFGALLSKAGQKRRVPSKESIGRGVRGFLSKMTVLDYYRLEELPFGVTPDSRYLFLTPTYKEALDSLVYGIEAGCGFVALIATPGLGKTTLLFEILNILRDKARIVFLFQTVSTPLDLLRSLLSGLGVRDLQGGLVEMQIRLKDLLTEQYRLGKRVVLVIDEAQNLDDSVLELVRMLSNFETARDKLIQIVLAGQPQLAENIGSPELLQLRQRISIFARLAPLTPEETTLYIRHRLQVAGYDSDMPLFTRDALAAIAESSEGIPRNINNLCFNALSLGCALKQKPIDREVLRQVTADLNLGRQPKRGYVQPKAEERRKVKVLESTSITTKRALLSGRLSKVAVAALVLLAVSTALVASQRWAGHPAAPPDPAVIARPAPVASVQPSPASIGLPDSAPPPHPRFTAIPSPAVSNATASSTDSAVNDANLSTVIPTAMQADPGAAPADRPAAMPVPPLLSVADPAQQPQDAVGTVQVAPGQTLLGICIKKFGSCTSELLRQIHELNPSLNNPDHIESGQSIRVPVLAAQSRAVEPTPRDSRTQ